VATKPDPEESITSLELRSRILTLIDHELLTERSHFE
jgi:hypothetical protein